MSKSRLRDRRGITCSWGVCVLLVWLAPACSPRAGSLPTPTPSSTPPPPASPPARFQMSGRVLDEHGIPVSGAIVEVDYAPAGSPGDPLSRCPSMAQFCWLSTRTNDTGEYALEFAPGPWPGRGLGYVYSFREGYEVDVQWVPVGPSPTIRDLSIRASRPILAGESIEVTVEPTSSLCTDLEDLWALGSRCEIVLVESGAGTLHVEARAASGGPAPSMFWYTSGNYNGGVTRPSPGVVSIPARGGRYRVMVALPEGAPAQQFKVTTSLR